MTIKAIIPGVTFTDSTLPKLYRDFAITPGTKFCFDALDTYSWAKQATPIIAGADSWKNLVDINTDVAQFLNASGAIGFNGGFDFLNTTGFPNITFPITSKPAAADSFLMIQWMKHVVGNAAAYTDISAIGGGSPVVQAYALTADGPGAQMRCTINQAVRANYPLTAGAVYQVALAAKKQISGTYNYYVYVNGALVQSVTSADTAIYQPSATTLVTSNSNASWKGKIFRTLYDNLSTTSDPATIVAADWAANNGRFS